MRGARTGRQATFLDTDTEDTTMFRFRRDVYLDHNATTRPSRRVRKRHEPDPHGGVRQPVLPARRGSPSGQRPRGLPAAGRGRDRLLGRRGVLHGERLGGQQHGAAGAGRAPLPPKKKIVSTPIEHPSIIATLEHLRGRGLVVEYLPVDRGGHVMMDRLEELIDETPSSSAAGSRTTRSGPCRT